MNLEDIYQNKIKNNKITSLSTTFDSPLIERDPTILNLEKNVFEQIQNIMPKQEVQNPINNTSLRTVSFEDALKELLELSKK
jgi:hypothetical protein